MIWLLLGRIMHFCWLNYFFTCAIHGAVLKLQYMEAAIYYHIIWCILYFIAGSIFNYTTVGLAQLPGNARSKGLPRKPWRLPEKSSLWWLASYNCSWSNSVQKSGTPGVPVRYADRGAWAFRHWEPSKFVTCFRPGGTSRSSNSPRQPSTVRGHPSPDRW